MLTARLQRSVFFDAETRLFGFGGITGLINASFTMNQVVHNTTWIPGHFHMMVGTAVALMLNLDRLTWWVVLAVVLIVVAYGPFFASYLSPNFVSPGFTLW